MKINQKLDLNTQENSAQKLKELLNSEPKIFNPKKPFKALETWKKLKPLALEEILLFSNKKPDHVNIIELEFKKICRERYHAIGQFIKGTSTEEGIVRIVSQNN